MILRRGPRGTSQRPAPALVCALRRAGFPAGDTCSGYASRRRRGVTRSGGREFGSDQDEAIFRARADRAVGRYCLLYEDCPSFTAAYASTGATNPKVVLTRMKIKIRVYSMLRAGDVAPGARVLVTPLVVEYRASLCRRFRGKRAQGSSSSTEDMAHLHRMLAL